jgi:Ni/Co efflux regulator RcnB
MNSKPIVSGIVALCMLASTSAFAQRNDQNDRNDRGQQVQRDNGHQDDRNDRGNQVQRDNGHQDDQTTTMVVRAVPDHATTCAAAAAWPTTIVAINTWSTIGAAIT